MKHLRHTFFPMFILLISFLLTLTGCPQLNTGNKPLPDKDFLRIHQDGEFDGFVEIYFDNYEEEILQSTGLYINRKKAGGIFNTVGEVYLYNTDTQSSFSEIPSSFIDFFVDDGTEYIYQLCFYDIKYNDQYTSTKKITANKGLGEISISQGAASFNDTTGILTFIELPSFDYDDYNSYFDSTYKYFRYSYPLDKYTYTFNFNMNDVSGKSLNVYNLIDNDWNRDGILGKKLTPDTYFINLYKYYDYYGFRYVKYTNISGLPSLEIPNPLPDVPLPENERFVRKHSGGEYDGFTEIYFDNYEEELLQSSDVYIQRKNANGDWDTVCDIYTEWNGYENPLFTDDLPPVIDYYADEGTEYKYRIHFYHYNSTGDNYDIYTSSQKMTADAGLGKISVTEGTASFNNATGILTFNTLPAFHYTPVNGYFDNTYEQLNYLFPYGNGTSSIYLNINDISDSKLNIYDRINDYWDNERFLGKTWTPGNYYLYLDKYINNYTIRYTTRTEITGLPSLEIPASLPD